MPQTVSGELGAETCGDDQDRFDAMALKIEQLRRAVESRDIIGQAKGMLMERFSIDADAAFDLLVKLSQRSNTPVAVIAQKIVEIDHTPPQVQ